MLIADRELVYFETDEGKEWATGYELIGVERGMLWNMGTENGVRRFDWRRLIANIYRTTDWYKYNPQLFTLESRQEWSRRKIHALKNGKLYV